jgi:peptide/nickel transport system permease protein
MVRAALCARIAACAAKGIRERGGTILGFIARRIGLAVPIWLLISVGAFALSHMARINPAQVLLGGVEASPAEILRMDHRLGLDRPLVAQYLNWLGNALRGNLGESYFQHAPVVQVLWSHAIVTATIAIPALLIAIALGVGAGVISATAAHARSHSGIDTAVTILSTLGMSIPEFWLAMLMILAFSVELGLFPPLGYTLPWQSPATWLRDVVLPASTIGLIQAAPLARMCRASMLDVLGAEFIRTARAKGIPEWRIIFVHALRAALLPVLTSMGVVVMLVLAGNFVIEVVFNIAGLGYLLVNSALQSDYPVIQGGVLLVGTVVIIVNLVVDVAYAWANPKVRFA